MSLKPFISNKRTIRQRFLLLIFLMLGVAMLLLILYLKPMNLNFRIELQIGLFLVMIILSVIFYRIRYYEIDFSGEVISIRSYHPVFPQYHKRSEFPKEKLNDFKIVKSNGNKQLVLYLKMLAKKRIAIRFPLYGFNGSKVKILEESLRNTKEKYNSEI